MGSGGIAQSSAWLRIRKDWCKKHPPNHEGYYVCGICGKSVHDTDMELDHINPRSGSPASFADFSNLQPTHSFCNRQKGSRRLKPLISAREYEFRYKFKL